MDKGAVRRLWPLAAALVVVLVVDGTDGDPETTARRRDFPPPPTVKWMAGRGRGAEPHDEPILIPWPPG